VLIRGFWWNIPYTSSSKAVVPKCIYCQNATTWVRCISLIPICQERSYKGLVKRLQLIATLYIPFENSQVLYFGFGWVFSVSFSQSWNLFSNSCVQTESKVAYFSQFTGLCFATVLNCTQLFAITWVSTALHPPHDLVSAQAVPIVHQSWISASPFLVC